jgi:cell division protein FtsB
MTLVVAVLFGVLLAVALVIIAMLAERNIRFRFQQLYAEDARDAALARVAELEAEVSRLRADHLVDVNKKVPR